MNNLDKIAEKIKNKEKILKQELIVLKRAELITLCLYKEELRNIKKKRKNELIDLLVPPPILEDPWLTKEKGFKNE